MTMHKFNKALSPFKRNDVTTVDCGNGWLVDIRQFQSVMPELRKAQAKYRAKGGPKKAIPKAQAQSVALSSDPAQDIIQSADEKEQYFLGSKQADMTFFAQHFITGWKGLKDDEGNNVPFSEDIAVVLLTETGTEGEQLYNELMLCSMDSKLFVVNTAQMAEEDAGNL